MAFGELSDPSTIIAIVSVVIVAVVIVIFGMRSRTRQVSQVQQGKQARKGVMNDVDEKFDLPFTVSKSVQTGDASHAKDELRILELEREILSDAIRRLYEAQAEGKISEQERERLAGTYKARMSSVKTSIEKDESIVALHELEGMQEDLMKLFSERFSELSGKVEELRSKIDVKPIKEIKVPLPTAAKKEQVVEEKEIEETEDEEAETETATEGEGAKPKKRRKPEGEKKGGKTEAEQRIDQIRSEVEKVLDKLGQMEIES